MKIEMLTLYAHWCPVCNMMLPLVEEIEKDFKGDIQFRRLDVETDENVYKLYDIQIVPTFIFYRNNREVMRMAGMIGEKFFRERLEKLVKGES